jgi:hypothetical protein
LKLEEDSVGEGLREGNGIDRELIELWWFWWRIEWIMELIGRWMIICQDGDCNDGVKCGSDIYTSGHYIISKFAHCDLDWTLSSSSSVTSFQLFVWFGTSCAFNNPLHGRTERQR